MSVKPPLPPDRIRPINGKSLSPTPEPLLKQRGRLPVTSAAVLLASAIIGLPGCGGGGADGSTATPAASSPTPAPTPASTPSPSSSPSPTPSPTPAPAPATANDNSVPTGLAVSSPTDIATSGSTVASLNVPLSLQLADGGRLLWDAINRAWASKSWQPVGTAIAHLTPIGKATAAPAREPEAMRVARVIDGILDGSIPLRRAFRFQDFFETDVNDPCFGPQVAYRNHDNGTDGAVHPSTGHPTLPSGDVGMWLDTSTAPDASTRPCAVGQLNNRMKGIRSKVNQGLFMVAGMRRLMADNSLAMPVAGATVDLTSVTATEVSSITSGAVTVSHASVARPLTGGAAIFRVVLSAGTGTNAQTVELRMTHTPASGTGYSGTMTFANLSLSNDVAFGCSDDVDSATSRYKVAEVGSIRYQRSSSEIAYSARSANYCGHGNSGSTHLAADIAALTLVGELDPSVKLSGSTRGGSKGWRGNFNRIGSSYDPTTHAGNYLLAWQAGPGDSHARMMAAIRSYNSVSETRNVKAYYAYGDAIDSTTADIQGLICNWAGPGGSHTPSTRFQHQEVELTSAASGWSTLTSKLSYAPTTSCNSSGTMRFDVNADGVLGATEGNAVTHNLDGLTGTRTTVQSELAARGFSKPSMF